MRLGKIGGCLVIAQNFFQIATSSTSGGPQTAITFRQIIKGLQIIGF